MDDLLPRRDDGAVIDDPLQPVVVPVLDDSEPRPFEHQFYDSYLGELKELASLTPVINDDDEITRGQP